MKIISKYNDYYDSVMRIAYDDHIIYVRKGSEEPDTVIISNRNYVHHDMNHKDMRDVFNNQYFQSYARSSPSIWSTARHIHNAYMKINKKIPIIFEVEPFLIGFCGKFFIGYRLKWGDKIYIINKKSDKIFESIDKKVVINYTPDIIRGNPDDIFIKYGCPIFLMTFNHSYSNPHVGHIYKNPILKNFGFQRIYDPYTAFQEISMYLGSVFVDDNTDMDNVNDFDMSRAKGFDEWSFKKMPSKKR